MIVSGVNFDGFEGAKYGWGDKSFTDLLKVL